MNSASMNSASMTKAERLDGMTHLWAYGSRIVLALTGILVLVMPLTEYLWDFDNFLRGGQDIELGLFSVAMVVCLILVLLQHGSRGFSLILAVRERICFLPQSCDNSALRLSCDLVLDVQYLDVPSPAISQYTLPILV